MRFIPSLLLKIQNTFAMLMGEEKGLHMYILALNCGSSSLKYQVFDADTKQVVVGGLVEKIDGSFSGVVGLPLELCKELIEKIENEA